MNIIEIQKKIECNFRKQVQNDKKVENAYLLVYSDKYKINLNIAEGKTGDFQANINQPNHLASVGKLFTATIISILQESGKLNFNDKISKYLDEKLINNLHFFKGADYSNQITIRHLLMQSSGLNDVFYKLWKKFTADKNFTITPRDAILWGKENLKPVAIPGKKHYYTDTNYYLLGLIIENITNKPFPEVMHQFIFDPLGMENAFFFGMSKPKVDLTLPIPKMTIKGYDLLSIKGIHQIDYSGGSVVAPLSDYLKFMKNLVNHKIIKKETLDLMINDDIYMGFPTISFNYGYSIWKIITIPVILPKKYFCWGCVGVTGAFMFYHPITETYIIGSFNDFSYRGKALSFMFKKIIKEIFNIFS